MPDDYIDGLFDDAIALYPGATDQYIFTAALLEGAKDLRSAAMLEVDYQANTASEKLSQRYSHLNDLVKELEQDLETLEADAGIPVGWAGLHKVPPTVRDYPADHLRDIP